MTGTLEEIGEEKVLVGEEKEWTPLRYTISASLVKDSEGMFNIRLKESSKIVGSGSETYIFPEMVSEEEARGKYDSL